MNKSEKFWDRSAKEYDTKKIKWEQIYNKAVENTKEYLQSDFIILDYGCGAGVITAQLAEYVKGIIAIDISSGMLDAAKRNAADKGVNNIKFEKATIFDDIYKKESFDVITAFNIFHLLENIDKEMERIKELLKPGGLLISETPCLAEKKSFFGGFLKFLSKLRIAPYLNLFKFSDLENFIIESEFKIIKAEDLEQNLRNYYIVAKKE